MEYFTRTIPKAKGANKDLFTMSAAQLRQETVPGRTARAKAAKAELARRAANRAAAKASA